MRTGWVLLVLVAASAAADPKKPGSSRSLALQPGEKLRTPNVDMPWTPPAGRMKVTLVDVDGSSPTSPPTAKIVVWSETDGKRHDVVAIKHGCLGGEHGAEMWTGDKNTVIIRCESESKPKNIVADEWNIRWLNDKDYPTLYRHWQGPRDARDPKWAGGRRFYGKPKPVPKDDRCCCKWDNEDLLEEPPHWQSRDYCKGSDDQHGHCIAASKCPAADEE
jgi:hypothetical protein